MHMWARDDNNGAMAYMFVKEIGHGEIRTCSRL